MTVAELVEKLKEYPDHYVIKGMEHTPVYKDDCDITLVGKNIGNQEVYIVFNKN